MARTKGPGTSSQAAEVVARFRAVAEPILADLGLELVDAEFRRESHGWVLRLYMDKPGGVTLDDCQRVSDELGDQLDVEDFIGYPYHLEVSSPGLDRALTNILFAVETADVPYGISFSEMKEYTKALYGLSVSVGYLQIPNLSELFKRQGISEKVIFYGVDDIKTSKLFYKIYALIKKVTPSFASFYNPPYNKLHGVVTRHDL